MGRLAAVSDKTLCNPICEEEQHEDEEKDREEEEEEEEGPVKTVSLRMKYAGGGKD